MHTITTKNLTEPLTLLIPERQADGEGGWQEIWKRGPTVWAALWPLFDKSERPHYRIVIRASIALPSKLKFLWPLRFGTKRLRVTTSPTLIQYNRFLCMTAEEDTYA